MWDVGVFSSVCLWWVFFLLFVCFLSIGGVVVFSFYVCYFLVSHKGREHCARHRKDDGNRDR